MELEVVGVLIMMLTQRLTPEHLRKLQDYMGLTNDRIAMAMGLSLDTYRSVLRAQRPVTKNIKKHFWDWMMSISDPEILEEIYYVLEERAEIFQNISMRSEWSKTELELDLPPTRQLGPDELDVPLLKPMSDEEIERAELIKEERRDIIIEIVHSTNTKYGKALRRHKMRATDAKKPRPQIELRTKPVRPSPTPPPQPTNGSPAFQEPPRAKAEKENRQRGKVTAF